MSSLYYNVFAIDQLQCEFECTDWNMFVNSAIDIDELTETVSAYINFCTDNTIPTKQVKVFPNNKPWITKPVKNIINKKKGVFGKGDKAELKAVQKELKSVLAREKSNYKSKIEDHFKHNNMKKVWQGMRLMSGFSSGSKTQGSISNNTTSYANDLNNFYNRFDEHDFSEQVCNLRNVMCENDDWSLITSVEEVQKLFACRNPVKAAGPDQMSNKVLKYCSRQIADVFCTIFNMCFKSSSIPTIWKRSCIVPVPKKPGIKCMNDLRPVALTSVVMKVCERILLKRFKVIVEPYLDPAQFAYRNNRSTDDAILTALDKVYHHLEGTRHGNSVRLMFFDFSSAFNTIQPHVLIDKLLKINVPKGIALWVLNYLTNRSQYVRLNTSVCSDMLNSNTGAPQGTVLAPFLFTLYTHDCRSSTDKCPIVKFADDTAMLGLIEGTDDTVYNHELSLFVSYCDTNYLQLNVSKTKEMLIDFRKQGETPEPVMIKGCNVERTTEYKYLGVIIDNKLSWKSNTDYIIKKLNTRMYCMRKLYLFDVDSTILSMFYNSVVASIWQYCLLCWGGNTTQTDNERINVLIRRAGRMIGTPQPDLIVTYTNLLEKKLKSIWDDTSHPLHFELSDRVIERSGRLRQPKSTTLTRYPKSFIPKAIKCHNSNFVR